MTNTFGLRINICINCVQSQVRVYQEITNGFERDSANQNWRLDSHPLHDWLIVSSSWRMQTWASAILSNQWLGHGAQRTCVRAVCDGETEGATSTPYVERLSITDIHRNDKTEITWQYSKDTFFKGVLSPVLYAFVLMIFFVLEGNDERGFTAANQFSSSRPGNYNEKCRWHIFSHNPGITIAKTAKKKAGKNNLYQHCLLQSCNVTNCQLKCCVINRA